MPVFTCNFWRRKILKNYLLKVQFASNFVQKNHLWSWRSERPFTWNYVHSLKKKKHNVVKPIHFSLWSVSITKKAGLDWIQNLHPSKRKKNVVESILFIYCNICNLSLTMVDLWWKIYHTMLSIFEVSAVGTYFCHIVCYGYYLIYILLAQGVLICEYHFHKIY